MGFNTHGGTTQARTRDPLRVRQIQYGLSGPHKLMAANGHQNGAARAGEPMTIKWSLCHNFSRVVLANRQQAHMDRRR